MRNAPACLTSTRNSVCSPCLAETVTVSTTSRRSLPIGCTLVFRSSEICGFHWPLARGPCGASNEQSFRYTPCSASVDGGACGSRPRRSGVVDHVQTLWRAGSVACRSAMERYRAALQQRVEVAGGIELVHVVRAADVALADENLRHRARGRCDGSSPRAARAAPRYRSPRSRRPCAPAALARARSTGTRVWNTSPPAALPTG